MHEYVAILVSSCINEPGVSNLFKFVGTKEEAFQLQKRLNNECVAIIGETTFTPYVLPLNPEVDADTIISHFLKEINYHGEEKD